MSSPAPAARPGALAQRLDALERWRDGLQARLDAWQQALAAHELLTEPDAAALAALHERLGADALVLAFVAEFSRGKSELINAIFFADTGRRVLPATPGRTTMCPVELRHDGSQPPLLALLPIATRELGHPLAALRRQPEHWEQRPLDPGDPAALAQALAAVTETRRVSLAQARAWGLWRDGQDGQDTAGHDNPPAFDDGTVEVPAWRHALISYPHPLLQRGLVVIDTPGLNAIGAEPELTLGLLPSAHAAVFVLAADTGVTRSDLALWREHLGQAGLDRFVVLNKIDTLADPLATPAEVQAQIERQRAQAAATLAVPAERVFGVSARQALAARVAGDGPALAASGVPAFEAALVARLLPGRQQGLAQAAAGVLGPIWQQVQRRIADRRRQQAEQMLELRGLRGKSGAKLRLLVERVDLEAADFERCTARLAALRAVQQRLLRGLLAGLASDVLRNEVRAMQAASGPVPFILGARPAFDGLLGRLRGALDAAAAQAEEMRQMLEASFRQLNTEFGFAFVLAPPPALAAFHAELALIEQAYGRYFSAGQAWRLAAPGFAEQFRRMLLSKLRVVFENAAGELEMWSKSAASQLEVQLRERRRSFTRRREALQRVQAAAGELEQRIAEVQAQDEALDALAQQLQQQAEALLALSRRAPAAAGAEAPDADIAAVADAA